MKKIVSCIAILAMMSAMASCGDTAYENSAVSSNITVASTSVSATAATSSDISVTTAANSKSADAKAENKKTDNKDSGSSVEAEPVANSSVSPVNKSDYMLIVGTWNEENALDPRTLTVDGDGRYKLSYRGGGSEYGTVRIDHQVLGEGDHINVWYCFCKDDGTEWESFRLSFSDYMPPVLISSFDTSALSFVFDSDATAEPADSSTAAAKRFIGTWECGRCCININNNGSGTYNADVKWSSSAADGIAWTYICTYDEENDALVCSGSGMCVEYSYSEDGAVTSNEKYSNGSAMFCTDENGNLRWHDYNANTADGMEFTQC